MAAEPNKALVADIYTEAFSKGNFSVFYYSFADDYVNHGRAIADGGSSRGYARFIATLRAAFPDLQVTVEEQFSDEDTVVTYYTMRGTQRGELAGLPATGRIVEMCGAQVDRIEGGKIAETWANWNVLGMMMQLGILRPGLCPEQDGGVTAPTVQIRN